MPLIWRCGITQNITPDSGIFTSRVPRERKKESEMREALPDGQALSHGRRLQNREGAQITENKTKETSDDKCTGKAFLSAKQN